MQRPGTDISRNRMLATVRPSASCPRGPPSERLVNEDLIRSRRYGAVLKMLLGKAVKLYGAPAKKTPLRLEPNTSQSGNYFARGAGAWRRPAITKIWLTAK